MPVDALNEPLDLFVWEGMTDILSRAERCLAGYEVTLIRADENFAFPSIRERARPAVALVSASLVGDDRFSGYEWLSKEGVPVIWVASENRVRDPGYFPPEYSYTLPPLFTSAELRQLLSRLIGHVIASTVASGPRRARPFIATSGIMRDLMEDAHMYAGWRNSVLVYGETGVGKERIARVLHEHAPWAAGPFVAVNCGAVPEGLFESQFFGYAKGAFTGAAGAHKGYFEQASGGTLFLDEIGDLPLYQQVKLLRVLEDGVVTRLGSAVEVAVEFRLVTATNKRLRDMVRDGSFRADLYYRLAVIELRVPSLQERGPKEKLALFESLLDQETRSIAGEVPPWLANAIAQMEFPGNVRELMNFAERCGIVASQSGGWDRPRIERLIHARDRAEGNLTPEPSALGRVDINQAERNRILEALQSHGWRRQDTANALGISRKALWEKMRKLHLSAQSDLDVSDVSP